MYKQEKPWRQATKSKDLISGNNTIRESLSYWQEAKNGKRMQTKQNAKSKKQAALQIKHDYRYSRQRERLSC